MKRPIFPFSAILGQDQMKKALIYNAIDSSIGGVLIRGQKGTAKSTAVRGIAHLRQDLETFGRIREKLDRQRDQRLSSY